MNAITKAQVSEELMAIGISPGLLGFGYARDAILMVCNEPKLIRAITKSIYPKVAEENGTTPSRVERAIRHSVERAFDNPGCPAVEYFKGLADSNKGKVTNSTFIATIAERMRIKLEEGV